MSGLSKQQPPQISRQSKMVESFHRTTSPRDFIDPSKMAERKEVTDARVEGFIEGDSAGFKKGLAVGILCTALFFILVWTIGNVAQANAQNPDVPNSAIALDMGMGSNFGDDLQESRLRLEILMPITDRLTITAKAENRRFDLRDYQTDGLWRFQSRTTFWEIGCKFYIGKRED